MRAPPRHSRAAAAIAGPVERRPGGCAGGSGAGGHARNDSGVYAHTPEPLSHALARYPAVASPATLIPEADDSEDEVNVDCAPATEPAAPPAPPRRSLLTCLLRHPLARPLAALALVAGAFPALLVIPRAYAPVPLKLAVAYTLAGVLACACMPPAPVAVAAPTPSRRVANNQDAPHMNHRRRRRRHRPRHLLLTACLPVAAWLTLFALTAHWLRRASWLEMPPVDAATLPAIDTYFLGQPAHWYFVPASAIPNDNAAEALGSHSALEAKADALDVLAWLVYGVWHFASFAVLAGVLGVWGVAKRRHSWPTKRHAADPESAAQRRECACHLSSTECSDGDEPEPPAPPHHHRHRTSALAYPRRAFHAARRHLARRSARARHIARSLALAHVFLAYFGSVQLAGVLAQFVWPTAPAWWFDAHGTEAPADPLHEPGSPAGLARIDALFGAHTYAELFKRSPVVFGAWPSLHAAFAACIALAACAAWPAVRVRGAHTLPTWPLGVGYVLVVCWSTLRLGHHYAADLVAGVLLAAGMWLAVAKKRAEAALAAYYGRRRKHAPGGWGSVALACRRRRGKHDAARAGTPYELVGGDGAARAGAACEECGAPC